MGFFSDLKEDLSQVMNELLPESVGPPREEEQAEEALAAETLMASEQESPSEAIAGQFDEEPVEDPMNFDGLKVSLEEMLASLDVNLQLPEETEEVEPADRTESSDEASKREDYYVEEIAQPPQETAEEEPEQPAWARETLDESESPEMAALLQQMIEANFPEEPEAMNAKSAEQIIEEDITEKILTAEGLEEAMAAVNLDALVEELTEEAESEAPLEVAPEDIAAFAESYGKDTAETLVEETAVEPPEEEAMEQISAEEDIEEAAAEAPEEAPEEEAVEEISTEKDVEEAAAEAPGEAPEEEAVEEISTEDDVEEAAAETSGEAPEEEAVEEISTEDDVEEAAAEAPGEAPEEVSVEEMPADEDIEEAAVQMPEEVLTDEATEEVPAEETLQDVLAEETILDSAETTDKNISEVSEEDNETKTINYNQEVKEQMNEMENAQVEEITEENLENPAEDQSEESKGEGIHMEIGVREAVDETSIITEGMQITGDIISEGSIDLIGTVVGNIDALGKLNITGHINGNSKAAEIYAEGAKINGEVVSEGAVKIGASSVVIGNITATSAAIAGAVKGDIDVHGPVILDSSAIVMGNIKSKSVQINNGAVIEGMCSQCYADISPTSFFEEYKSEPRKAKNK